MKRVTGYLLIILCCFHALSADISISGTVKKSGTTAGIEGAGISLSLLGGFSAITDPDGNFLIEGTDLKRSLVHRPGSFQITFKGRYIHLTTDYIDKECKIAVYSVAGKRLFYKALNSHQPGRQTAAFPYLSPGIYILRIILDGTDYTYQFTCMGNRIFLNNQHQNSSKVGANLSLSQTMSAVDTLVAAKAEYITKKIPLGSYVQKDISITLDSVVNDPDEKKGLTVFFIRHAETVANASGQQGGGGPLEDHDTLTELGERQVEALKDYLIDENIKPDLVVVSPSLRTQKTIEPFLIASGLKAEIWVEINECCGDEPTGEPLPTERPDPRWKMKVEPMSGNFLISGETDKYYWWPQSYEEGVFMVMTAQKRLMERFSQSGKTVMVIGHAVNGGIFLGLLRGYDMLTTKPDRPVYLMNTAVVKLTQDTTGGAFTLKQNLNRPPR